MRAGDKFPALVVDGDYNIVSGHHRYEAMKNEYGDEYLVNVIVREYHNKVEKISDAIKENAKHGNPMDGITRKRAVLKLSELGSSPEFIASLFSISVKRVEDIAGMCVVVVGSNEKNKDIKPLKRGLEHVAGRAISQKEYDKHIKLDRAMPVRATAQQLSRWIKAGWINKDDASTMEALNNLAQDILSLAD